MNASSETSFRFTGHETFPCRYAWLPKAVRAITATPSLFSDEDAAMVQLGVGKNMVRSLRFWVYAAGVVEDKGDENCGLTDFGRAILADGGYDPFLEDIRTLWLLHWQLCSHTVEPLFAWDYMFNRWQHPEINRTSVLSIFRREAERMGRSLSAVTLEQHFDVFLHTYIPTKSRKGEIQEDNLDCPLVELDLIESTGERRIDSSGKRESVYEFRRDNKPDVTAELLIYCIDDFWRKRKASELTLTFRDIAVAEGSPGQIFKLTESAIRERLETIESDSKGAFVYRESAALQQLNRGAKTLFKPLGLIYCRETTND